MILCHRQTIESTPCMLGKSLKYISVIIHQLILGYQFEYCLDRKSGAFLRFPFFRVFLSVVSSMLSHKMLVFFLSSTQILFIFCHPHNISSRCSHRVPHNSCHKAISYHRQLAAANQSWSATFLPWNNVRYLYWWMRRDSIHFALPKLFREYKLYHQGAVLTDWIPPHGSTAMKWISIFVSITDLAQCIKCGSSIISGKGCLPPSFHAWLSWVTSIYFQHDLSEPYLLATQAKLNTRGLSL